jgi:hypothetical protein
MLCSAVKLPGLLTQNLSTRPRYTVLQWSVGSVDVDEGHGVWWNGAESSELTPLHMFP